jgi:hypothetical protein
MLRRVRHVYGWSRSHAAQRCGAERPAHRRSREATTVVPVRSGAELDVASRGIPDDFQFGRPAYGGKDLIDAA